MFNARMHDLILPELRRVARDLVFDTLIGSAVVPSFVRFLLLRALGVRVARCTIFPHSHMGRRVHVGVRSFINYECFFDDSVDVTIGADCEIGMRVIFAASHDVGAQGHRAGANRGESITVGDGVWIGAGATILSGATIGDGAVIGAGALVRGPVPPNTVYVGIPAKFLSELSA